MDSARNITHCQANMISTSLSLFNMVNRLRNSQTIDLGLMLLGTDNQMEMEEGFTWLILGVTVIISKVLFIPNLKSVMICCRVYLNV